MVKFVTRMLNSHLYMYSISESLAVQSLYCSGGMSIDFIDFSLEQLHNECGSLNYKLSYLIPLAWISHLILTDYSVDARFATCRLLL